MIESDGGFTPRSVSCQALVPSSNPQVEIDHLIPWWRRWIRVSVKTGWGLSTKPQTVWTIALDVQRFGYRDNGSTKSDR